MSRPTIHVEHKRHMPSLRVSGLVLLSAASAGAERAYQHAVERMYLRGETQESLLREVQNAHMPAGLKRLVSERVQDRPQKDTPAIEVDSVVECLVEDVTVSELTEPAQAEPEQVETAQQKVPGPSAPRQGRDCVTRVETGSGGFCRAFSRRKEGRS